MYVIEKMKREKKVCMAKLNKIRRHNHLSFLTKAKYVYKAVVIFTALHSSKS
jgi:hypothetical protein